MRRGLSLQYRFSNSRAVVECNDYCVKNILGDVGRHEIENRNLKFCGLVDTKPKKKKGQIKSCGAESSRAAR